MENVGEKRTIRPAIILALVMLTRLVMAVLMPVTPEEAYHWNWARHLDWSYYDHPPMVAWGIAVGRLVAGDTALGIRLVPLLFSLGTSLLVAWLARRFYGARGAAWAVFLLALEPCVLIIGGWAFPDAPLLFFWALTLAFVWRALEEKRPAFWLAAGAALGGGMLSKYTAAFLVPSVLGFLVFSRAHRRWLASPWPYLAGAVSLLVFWPVVYWNSVHDWVSFHFQSASRFHALRGFSLSGAGNHFCEQWLSILPFTLPLAGVACWHGARSARPEDRFLFWTFLPMSAFFAVFGMTPHHHLLWPMPAYVGLTVLMAGVVVGGQGRVARFYRVRVRWVAGGALAALLVVLGLGSGGMPGMPHAQEFFGWNEVARRAWQERQHLPAGSFYLAIGIRSYPFPSQLALHLGDPEDVRTGTLIGEDILNYRFWDHPEQLTGKDGVLILEDGLQNAAMLAILGREFESVEPAGEVDVPVGKMPFTRPRRLRFLFYRAHAYRGPQSIGPDISLQARKDP
jgi:dolichol-phosphate mannosyltransferase